MKAYSKIVLIAILAIPSSGSGQCPTSPIPASGHAVWTANWLRAGKESDGGCRGRSY